MYPRSVCNAAGTMCWLPTTNSSLNTKVRAPSIFGTGTAIILSTAPTSKPKTKSRVAHCPPKAVLLSLMLSGPNNHRQHHPQPSTTSVGIFPMSSSKNTASPAKISDRDGSHPDHEPSSDPMLRRVRCMTSVQIAKIAGEAAEKPKGALTKPR